MSDELERMGRDSVVAYFNVLSQHRFEILRKPSKIFKQGKPVSGTSRVTKSASDKYSYMHAHTHKHKHTACSNTWHNAVVSY